LIPHENKSPLVNVNCQHKIAFTTNSNETVILRNLSSDTADNLSYQLAMSRDLSEGDHKIFDLPVDALDINKQPMIKNIMYSAPHKAELPAALGNLQTYHVMNQDDKEWAVTTLCLAPKYHLDSLL